MTGRTKADANTEKVVLLLDQNRKVEEKIKKRPHGMGVAQSLGLGDSEHVVATTHKDEVGRRAWLFC